MYVLVPGVSSMSNMGDTFAGMKRKREDDDYDASWWLCCDSIAVNTENISHNWEYHWEYHWELRTSLRIENITENISENWDYHWECDQYQGRYWSSMW